MPRPVINQAQIESMILDLCDRLETLTEDYADVCDRAHETEMDYKHRYHTAIIALSQGPKTTSDVRAAKAWLGSEQALRDSGTAQASKEAMREALRSTTVRIEALRTLAANVRHQTT